MDTETGVDVVVSNNLSGEAAENPADQEHDKADTDCTVNRTYLNPAFVPDSNVTPRPGVVHVIHDAPDNTGIAVITPIREQDDDISDMPPKYLYGWKCITPNALQVLNRPIVFLICLCMGVIAQGLTVGGISLASLTVIEKQFGFKSSEVALFLTVYDTAYGTCSLFIGYIGTFHKPRYLGCGLLIMVFGAVLVSIPKFKIGQYTAGDEKADDFCRNGTQPTEEPCAASSDWLYKLIFNIGFIILGFGATPLYTLGPAHIDDVTERGQSSIYLGIFYASSAIGPAIGFIIAMPLLKEWVELDTPPPFARPTDQQWVGAWWVGFLIGAGLLLIPVIPMLGLSRIFPDTEGLRQKKREIPDTVPENRELIFAWPAVKALLRNPPFMCISLAIAAESLAVGGFSTFIPKFVETQFHISASRSALYTGLMGIPSAAGGVLLGGYLVKRFEWNCKEILLRASIMALISALCTGFILVGCHTNDIKIPTTSAVFNVTACNTTCNCNLRYKPICTEGDEKTYYSPCYAGCRKIHQINNTYSNCSCFPSNITFARPGRCKPDTCPLFPLFCVGIFFLVIFTFLNNVPLINATFRVVNAGQGSFAMGFQQILIRFLGFIPSPIMYGALIDRSCNLWQNHKCNDDTTNCLEYDNEYFRYYVAILALTTKLLACIFMLLAYKLYKFPVNRTAPHDVGVDNITREVGVDNNVTQELGVDNITYSSQQTDT